MEKKQGDIGSFDRNWRQRKEALYTHWTREHPANQIQLAFRQHWDLFSSLMKSPLFNRGKRCLEVGCGRGSMSAYFSDAGYTCTLLDLSESVVGIARNIFALNSLKGRFVVADAEELSFPDCSFDVVVSIGLLEHFEDIEPCIREQCRVLDSGGIFLGYVVPKYTQNIQKDYIWLNDILKGYADIGTPVEAKAVVYRSDADSTRYLEVLERNNLCQVCASGVYPLPMISHSIEFPFTLMPQQSEAVVVKYFENILATRRQESDMHPWLCDEGYGQAFLVWGFKNET